MTEHPAFEAHADLLVCPLCRGGLHLVGKMLVCAQKHCFDIARQSYVNLLPNRSAVYPRALFEHRRRIYDDGFYAPFIQRLDAVLESLCEVTQPVLLDAGCGEGYYVQALRPHAPCTRLGFDISKEAVQLAARRDKRTLWMVAELGNIPVRTGAVDVVLNVLTPAHYAEFSRVLREGGLLVKVVPGSGYLGELRALADAHLRSKAHDNAEVLAYFESHAGLIHKEQVAYTLPVRPEQALSWACMTPLLMGVDIAQLHLEELTSITIALDIFVGRKAAHTEP